MEALDPSAKPARCPTEQLRRAGRWLRPFALVAVGASLPLLGCAPSAQRSGASASLVAGRRAGLLPPAQLAPAVSLARRFANAYARDAYLAAPPRLPGATPVVQRELALAAARVPAPRRARRPRIGGFRIEAKGAALRASVSVKDGYDPPFSVGFLLAHRGARWRIVAVSPPS